MSEQGQRPDNVFVDAYPMVYAAMSALNRGHEKSSEIVWAIFLLVNNVSPIKVAWTPAPFSA